MTTPAGCPSCGSPLTGAPTCATCGLPLSGPLAYRLWQVDQQLTALQSERETLMERLRAGETAQPAPAVQAPTPPAWPTPPRRESSPKQVQNTLLTLGAVLLAGAGIVFTAVTYQHLGVVGRALVLLVLTSAAALAPTRLLRRGLTASAESVAAVAVVLCLLDLYALRHAGAGKDVAVQSYAAVGFAVVTALLAAYSLVVPVRVSRWAAAVLGQLPLVFLLSRVDAAPSTGAAWLAVQAGADVVLVVGTRLYRDVKAVLLGLAAVLVLATLALEAPAIDDGARSAWVGLAILAAGAAVGAWRFGSARDFAGAFVVPLLAAASWAGVRPDLTAVQQPLVLAAVTVLGLQVTGLLPRDRRLGPVAGALAVTAVSLAVEAEAVLQAVVGPFTWLTDPWSRTAATARQALAVHRTFDWTGTVVTLVVLAGAALAVVTAGLVLDRVAPSLVPAAVLLVLTGVTLPLGFATSYQDAIRLLLVLAGVLSAIGAGALRRARLIGVALVSTGAATALLAAAWSTADRMSTLWVLPVVALLCAALAVALPGALTSVALLLGAGELAAVGVDRGLAADQVGGLLLAAVALCTALSFVLPGLHRLGAEAAAAGASVAAVACAVDGPGWLSWTLAGAGLAALVVSVRRDRRLVGLGGALLLSASSWVRLADAHVHAPEPYVAPLAVAALVVGWLRRRSHPTASSWEVYGSGLALALVPSLAKAFDDSTPTRGLLLLVVSVGVVVVGAMTRQQAPLTIGAVVGVLDALWLLAPYATALPRWLLLAVLGLLLVVIGATYEARLRDLRRWRSAYDSLR